MIKLSKKEEIKGTTNVVGLIGNPIKHSFSPQMHNRAFEYLNMDYVYIPFNVVENLGSAIEGAKRLNIKGLNVTIPHKVNVIPYLDEIDPVASLIGAVNTIKFTQNSDNEIIAKGYNTDALGCIKALEEVTTLKDKKVIVVGAGGASRAIAFQLANSSIDEMVLLNRCIEKPKKIVTDIKSSNKELNIFFDELVYIDKYMSNSDILIDTTPVGMYPHVNDKAIVRADMIHEDMVVNDIVYNPIETSLIKEAKKANAQTVSGIKMLLYQGVESFKIWTGVDGPTDQMEKALYEVLGLN